MVEPYTDVCLYNDIRVRTFSPSVDDSELIWHRDKRDRIVEVIKGEGWKFQFEDELPFELSVGDTLTIEKMKYHRLLLGDTELALRITER